MVERRERKGRRIKRPLKKKVISQMRYVILVSK